MNENKQKILEIEYKKAKSVFDKMPDLIREYESINQLLKISEKNLLDLLARRILSTWDRTKKCSLKLLYEPYVKSNPEKPTYQ